jgi:predicted permease
MAEVGVDARVLAFTAAVTLGCALFFGFFPLLRYGIGDLAGRLREGGARGGTGGRERHRLRNGLVVVQVAMALVLLVASGLMLRSFVALRAVDPGFDAAGVLTARIVIPAAEIPDAQQVDGFSRQLRERMEAQPGVVAAGFTSGVPLGGGYSFQTIEVEDQPRAEGELPVFANIGGASPGYFEAMGIPLREGRTLRPEDGATGTRAVVVAEAFAKHWWPNGSALGRRLRFGIPDEAWWEIVGVVADVHLQGLEAPPEEMVWFPPTLGTVAEPFAFRGLDVVVKTMGDPLQLVPVLRRELGEVNPRIPLATTRAMEEVVAAATARTSFTMALLGAASGIALLLGLVGIYGVVSYVVSQRTREIGVRMALGASAPSVRRMVVRQGLALAGAGVGVGLVAAGLASTLMSSLLYGVRAIDPVTYAAVAAALVAVATAASWIPARRAAGVDPAWALRAE